MSDLTICITNKTDESGNVLEYLLIGAIVDGQVLTIDDLAVNGNRVFEQFPNHKFTSFGPTLSLCKGDDDNTLDISTLLNTVSSKYPDVVVDSWVVTDLDSDRVKECKLVYQAVYNQAFFPYTSVPAEKFSILFTKYMDYKKNSGSYWNDKVKALTNQNILKNTDDDTKKLIESIMAFNNTGSSNILGNSGQSAYRNRVLSDEGEKVFFVIDDSGRVTPSYNELNSDNIMISEDSYTSCGLRNLVPAYHRYIGGYINFNPGTNGEMGTYVTKQEAFIKNGEQASFLNDFDFAYRLDKDTSCSSIVLANGKTIMKNSEKKELLIGNPDYDSDDIRDNEREYYEALCKFIDECTEKDLEDGYIDDWAETGFDLTKYIPNYSGVVRSVKLSEIDYIDGTIAKEESRKFTKEKQEQAGLTAEVIKNETVGSPTANKWFKYAINVALVATRAYTGCIPVPAGYDIADFVRTFTKTDTDMRTRYNNMMREVPLVFDGTNWRTEDYFDSRATDTESDSDGEDAVIRSIDDVTDLNSVPGSKYWREGYLANGCEEVVNKLGISDNISMTNGKVNYAYKQCVIRDAGTYNREIPVPDDPGAYSLYIKNLFKFINSSKSHYAYAEALIKCLRFGLKKPQSLQLNGSNSRFDLTRGNIAREVKHDNPVDLGNGKTSVITELVRMIVDESIMTALNEFAEVPSNVGMLVVSASVATIYEQEDGSRVVEQTYYDIDSLKNSCKLIDSLADFGNDNHFAEDVKWINVAEMNSHIIDGTTNPDFEYKQQYSDEFIAVLRGKVLTGISSETSYSQFVNNIARDYTYIKFLNALSNPAVKPTRIKVFCKYIAMGFGMADILKLLFKDDKKATTKEVELLIALLMLKEIGKKVFACKYTDNFTEAFENARQMYRVADSTGDCGITFKGISIDGNDEESVQDLTEKTLTALGLTGKFFEVFKVQNANGNIIYYAIKASGEKCYYITSAGSINLDSIGKYCSVGSVGIIKETQIIMQCAKVIASNYAKFGGKVSVEQLADKLINDQLLYKFDINNVESSLIVNKSIKESAIVNAKNLIK